MELEEILRSPALAQLGAMMLEESKMRTQRKYAALNGFAPRGQIVMTGDSIVEGFPLDEFFPQRIYNRGISGDTSAGLLQRLPETVLPLQPRLTLLWIGTNDLQDEIPIVQICHNVEQIGKLLEEAGSKVAIVSVAPVNMTSADGNIRNTVGKRTNAAIRELNDRYGRLCRDRGWQFLNIYPLLAENENLPEQFSEDGLHPNVAGYARIKTEIAAILP